MIEITRADITTVPVDAIVNAANSALRGGGGVDGAIHRAAGPELLRELMRFDRCKPGDAVLTAGYRLPARFVIHAVGPVWRGGRHGEPATLERAYESAFRVARQQGTVRSIAFPAISTGLYGYPREAAARIALATMLRHDTSFDRIVAALFDADSEHLYRTLFADLAPRA